MTRIAAKQVDENQLYLMLGVGLLSLFAAQLLLELRWEWLAQTQQGDFYRQLTGFLLLIYVLMQSRLGIKRIQQQTTNLKKILDTHKIYGVLGPVVFYIHSIEIGYAYQMVLTFVFLGNCIIGYLSPQALKLRSQTYLISWTVIHIGLAILTLTLMLFHIYVVYNYS